MAQDESSTRYFLSATQETSSRSRLFRPKELREFVFPGVGMIMHSLFWVKHTAHLHQLGADPLAQDSLFLYASRDEESLYDEGLLWYILASRSSPDSKVTLTAGKRTVKNWLFEPQYEYDGDIYDRIADELPAMERQGNSYDCERFVDDVFAQWFVTRCRERGIELEDRLQTDVINSSGGATGPGQSTELVISAFCELLGSLIEEHTALRGQQNLTVIGSTIRFATQLLIPENEPVIQRLTDTSFRFTADETTALLQAVAAIEYGRHFIRSILFVIYIDPVRHSSTEFSREMRRIHDLVTSDVQDILETGSRHLDISDLPSEITSDLDETSYYWLLNFFMADGETIARTLLDTTETVITRDDVETYFEDDADRTAEFYDFLARPEDGLEYLPRILAEISPEDSHRVHRFLSQLREDIEDGTEPPKVLLNLLEANGVIEEETEGTYRIREYPSNTNSASFYGIGPLKNWTETILASHE